MLKSVSQYCSNDTKVSYSGNDTEIYQAQTGCPKWSIRAFCKFLTIFSLIIESNCPLFRPVFLHAESPVLKVQYPLIGYGDSTSYGFSLLHRVAASCSVVCTSVALEALFRYPEVPLAGEGKQSLEAIRGSTTVATELVYLSPVSWWCRFCGVSVFRYKPRGNDRVCT